MMWKIKVITDGLCENDVNTIYFAAEELKKYLRMMMPESGNFNICFDAVNSRF